jgi:hypothetical protein
MTGVIDPAVHRPVMNWAPHTAPSILEEARRRFRIRMIAGKGRAAAEDATALCDEMLAATQNMFCPSVGQTELTVSCCRSDMVIINGAMLPGGPWAGHLYDGDRLLLYCITAGATREELWRACGEDPVLAAAAHLLGSEVNFALGRTFDRSLRAQSQHHCWHKIALLSSETRSHDRCRWDPKVGHSFFTAFAAPGSPVSITESGSFDPVHTVLGLFRQSAHHP